MRERPMKEMESILTKCQCKILNNNGDISIQGPLKFKGQLEIDCSKTTQFISAFKMIEHKCSEIEFLEKDLNTSKAYYDLTLELIKQTRTKSEFVTPPDFSSLGYLLAAGLTIGEVHIENCIGEDPYQADSILLELIKNMKGDLKITERGTYLKPGRELRPIDIDCGGFPDLVPTLAYLCSYCHGTSKLKNLEVLTYKESNRFEEIKKLLTLFKVPFEEDGFDLIIHGPASTCGEMSYKPRPDHRMVMVGYLFMRKNNGGELQEIEHVKKSYGNFFSQFKESI
jgi:3-phosphoshikimate 1-carboxyvinyltransferase